MTCVAPNCDRPVLAKGVCGMHYQRLAIRGSFDTAPRPSDMDRFMAFVNKLDYVNGTPVPGTGGCWEWLGGNNGRMGHGVFSFRHKCLGAHRAAWILFKGPIPAGMFVCHKCDNPPCVNPEHLFLGTNRDNILDAVAKGRHWTRPPRGEAASAAILTEKKVLRIRASHAAGMSQSQLAKRYGVAVSTVSAAVTRRTWKHI